MTSPARNDGFTIVELVVAGTILAVALAMVGNYIISAGRSVAQSTAHQDDNAAAQRIIDQLDGNIRFACSISISGQILYVANTSGTCTTPGEPACAEWTSSVGSLIETTASGTSTIARGVSALSFTSNSAYSGLVTFQMTLRQPQDQAADPPGVSINQTVTARNMSQPVLTGSALSGCP